MDDKNCQFLLDDLSDYLDGTASAAVCAEIQRHLDSCTDCRVVVDTLNKTIHLYRDLPQPEMSPGARERLYQALELDDYL